MAIKKKQNSNRSKPSQKAEAKLKPGEYRHETGIYAFRKGRTHVILKGTKYTATQAIKNEIVMNNLIERRYGGLIKIK